MNKLLALFAALYLSMTAWAAPSIVDVVATVSATDVSEFTVDMPLDVPNGDIILVVLTVDAAAVINPYAMPAPWVKLTTGGGIPRLLAVYRVADGTQSDFFTFTFTAPQQAVARAYRITGAVSITGSGNSASVVTANPDPAGLMNNAWAGKSLLVLAVAASDGDNTALLFPVNYGDNQYTQASALGDDAEGVSLSIASSIYNYPAGPFTPMNPPSSVNPGPFTLSEATRTMTTTLVIVP